MSITERARTGRNGRMQYPVRFFDMLRFEVPTNISDILKWSKMLYRRHGVVNQAVKDLASYPVTKIRVENDSEGDFWEELLNKKLKVQDSLIEIGTNYWASGNAFVVVHFPFERKLICSNDNSHSFNFSSIKKLTFRYPAFHGFCPKCKKSVKFTHKDIYTNVPERIKIRCLEPSNMYIKHIHITDTSRFFYRIPEYETRSIRKGDLFFIEHMPWDWVVASSKRHKAVEIKSDFLFHYKNSDITDLNLDPWGLPLVYPAWQEAFLGFVIRKAQESIASDHLTPLEYLFPEQQSSNDPLEMLDLGDFKQKVSAQVKKWQTDPNELAIFPVPVGKGRIRGDGKMLTLSQEIEASDRRVLAEMGIPYEFVFGGMQWSGALVAHRKFENRIIRYRHIHEQFLSFFKNLVGIKLNKLDKAEIKFEEFKMADDLQRKQLSLNLNQLNKISDETLLHEYDFDADAEYERIVAEKKQRVKINEVISEINAAGAKVNVTENAKAQIDAQSAQQERGEQLNMASQNKVLGGSFLRSPRAVARELLKLDTMARQDELSSMLSSDPEFHKEVVNELYGIKEAPQEQEQSNPDLIKIQPLPQAQAPTRTGSGKSI